ncbi:MAG: 50S ribosomal protein L17 [Sandaracinaceae bacterium]|nr:MAG: 50S ribosomal protein L17 [Sandaracinaceae bacterium]HBQ12337.1 50S ribosomal protein L17 [Myxococcales bacterium]
MRHRKAGRKFGRNTSHRRAMFRNLTGNLVLHERIETTEAKAKELRRIAERMITRAIRLGDDLTVDVQKLDDEERSRVLSRRTHAQRQVARFVPRRLVRTNPDGTTDEIDIVHKIFHDIAPRYVERAKADKGGGYTRITKMLSRKGDNAPMALIEILEGEEVEA